MNDQQKNSFTNDAFDGDADGVLTGKKSRPIQLRPEVSSEPEPQGCREIWRAWPKTTFCIVSNEFCERFSYYGMRTVLTLYLINILKVSDNGATALFHGFTVLAYSSPLLGSILADGYFGKFQTILWISLLYATGQVVLSVASTFAQSSSLHPYLDYTGLIIIAMGTGGIKPCVAAFGGDQFKIGQERMISLFFSMFYFSINAGSTISTFLTPEFRALPCMGRDSCYPLAFGIPAVLMVVATVFFVGGSFWYKKYPPKENVIFEVIKGIRTALANKRHFNVKRPHWMDHYLDNHSCESDIKCIELKSTGKKNKCHKRQFVDDVKSLLRVMVMYVPVPMFWALFDQQGSRWIIQGIAMDSRLSSSFSLLPDQMQTLNAILIMVFIPIFQLVIYPLVEKVGIKTTPLRRMSTGGLLAACAFVISALVQFKVNETLPDIPGSNQAFVSFINSYEGCTVNVSFKGNSKMIMPNSSLEDDKVTNQLNVFRIDGLPKNGLTSMGEIRTFKIAYSADNGGTCAGLPGVTDQTNGVTNVDVIDMEGGHSYYLVLGPQGVVQRLADWRKPTEGEGEFKMNINFMLPCSTLPPNVTWGNCNSSNANSDRTTYSGPMALCDQDDRENNEQYPCDPRHDGHFYAWQMYTDSKGKAVDDRNGTVNSSDTNWRQIATIYDYKDIKPGKWALYYLQGTPKNPDDRTYDRGATHVAFTGVTFQINGQGGIYSMTVSTAGKNSTNVNANFHTIVPANHISILWQIPQYVVITAAEILFSITGLEFSYSQAAPSMKSVVQALWLLTVAFGDLIILAIAAAALFSNMAVEMLAFAGAMVVVICVFILLSVFYYDYTFYTRDESEDDNDADVSGTVSTVE